MKITYPRKGGTPSSRASLYSYHSDSDANSSDTGFVLLVTKGEGGGGGGQLR